MCAWRNVSLARKTGLLLLALLLVFAAAALALHLIERQRAASMLLMQQYLTAQAQTRVLFTGVLYAESAQRSVLLMATPSLVGRARTAREAARVELRRLQQLRPFDDQQRELFAAIGRLVDQELRTLALLEQYDLRARLPTEDLGALLAQSEQQLRQIEQQLNRLQQFQQQHYEAELSRLEQAYRRNLLMAALALLLSVVIVLLTLVMMRDALRRMRVLADNARRLVEGKPLQVMAAAGDEVGQVAQALQHASTMLSSQHERLMTALACAGVLIWEFDVATGRLHSFASAETAALFGFTPETLPRDAQSALAFVEDVDRERVRRALQRAIEQGEAFDVEYRARTPQGAYYFHTIGRWHVDALYGRPYLLGITRNVTALRQTDRALRERDARYQAVVEQTSDAIALIDAASRRLIDINPAGAGMLGYDPVRCLMLTLYDVVALPPQQIDERLAAWLEMRGTPLERLRLRHAEGSTLDVEASVAVIGTERPVLSLVMRDVTEQLRAQAILRESEARYRAVVEQTTESIYLIDVATMRFIDANPAYQRLIGYSLAELRSMTLYDVVAHDRASVEAYTARIVTQGALVLGERYHRRRDGTLVPLEVSAVLISFNQQAAMCVVARDVSTRKQAEQALIRSKEAAEASSRTAQVLLARLSHELRTPLHAILGSVQLLESEITDEQQRTQIAAIGHAGQQLLALIDDVLALVDLEAQRSALALEALPLVPLVQDALLQARALTQQYQLSCVIDSSDVVVMADRRRLTQALVQVLRIALNALSPDARLTLRAHRDGARVRLVLEGPLQLALGSGWWRRAVEGDGAAPDLAGLEIRHFGWVLARRLVEVQGGTLGVTPRQGGVELWLELPRAPTHELQSAGGGEDA